MSDYLDRLEQRILALEEAIEPKQPAEDDEESKGCVWDIASVYSEKESLKTANAILHAKVAALRAESKHLAYLFEEQDLEIENTNNKIRMLQLLNDSQLFLLNPLVWSHNA